jgi:hypothetical protein
MTDIQHQVTTFIDQRETVVVREALRAVRDCLDLRLEVGLPVPQVTCDVILELEKEVSALKLRLLRHHPDQPPLPGMEDLSDAKDGEQLGDVASRSLPC